MCERFNSILHPSHSITREVRRFSFHRFFGATDDYYHWISLVFAIRVNTAVDIIVMEKDNDPQDE